jgi:hypothetical protein
MRTGCDARIGADADVLANCYAAVTAEMTKTTYKRIGTDIDEAGSRTVTLRLDNRIRVDPDPVAQAHDFTLFDSKLDVLMNIEGRAQF